VSVAAHPAPSAVRTRGLEEAEALRRLAELGPNELPSRAGPSYSAIAARQLADPLVALLLAAAAVSLLVGDRLEAVVIAAIVLLNAALGMFQEAGAERAVLALRSTLRPTAFVVRDGREREIAAREIVPGDVVVLREGDRVPADGRLVDGSARRLTPSCSPARA
jgi:magnesium-transporting ATPase (P-type)